MVNIIIVEKNSDLKSMKYVPEKDELYKKCKFKKEEGFELRTTWKVKKNKYDFEYVSMYARDSGKANTENKYDFPPPVDNVLYFGCCVLISHNGTDDWTDLSQDEWSKIYEDLFGGFENLDASAKEDEMEEDELENVPDELNVSDTGAFTVIENALLVVLEAASTALKTKFEVVFELTALKPDILNFDTPFSFIVAPEAPAGKDPD